MSSRLTYHPSLPLLGNVIGGRSSRSPIHKLFQSSSPLGRFFISSSSFIRPPLFSSNHHLFFNHNHQRIKSYYYSSMTAIRTEPPSCWGHRGASVSYSSVYQPSHIIAILRRKVMCGFRPVIDGPCVCVLRANRLTFRRTRYCLLSRLLVL